MHPPSTTAVKILNAALLVSFVLTVLEPLTGIIVHKLASTLFLLLCLVHTIVHRKKRSGKRFVLLFLIVLAYLAGLFGLIFDEIPLILAMHKVISIACVFFLAIHIFAFQNRLRG